MPRIDVARWNGTQWALADGGAPPMIGYPNATNTGLAAVSLTEADMEVLSGFGAFAESTWSRQLFNVANYTGTTRTRIDSGNFVATECMFIGPVDADNEAGSATFTRCDINGSTTELGVGYRNLTLTRCHIYGGVQSVNMDGALTMTDCYVHDPYLPPGTDAHINPFFCGKVGADKEMVIRHCSFSAPIENNEQSGGVSSSLSFFPDFGPICNVLVEDCWFGWTGGAYGTFLGWNPGKPFNDHPANGTNMTFRNNVFERGPSGINALYGPVTSWRRHATNTWENNRYEDGTVIPEPA